MHFLYPAFLFALLSLAIPVLVHLFNFRRYKKVYFSNVQFLKEVQEQQASNRNLRERLILASRLLTLFFVVLAFARPYVPGANQADAGKQQVVSIFVDNSYSMQTLNREGTLLDEAKQKAREIAASYGLNDRFQLLTYDFEGKQQRLLSRTEFNDAVDAVKISAQSRNLDQIINRQKSLMDMDGGSAKQSYIISDFQKNMAAADRANDAGFPVNMVYLKANPLPNVAVDSVWMINATHRPNENERVVVRLHNYADKIAEKIPLRLTINGSQKAIGSFTLPARSVQTDTLAFSGLQTGWQRAEIQLQDNPVTFDNTFYFTFKVTDKLPVLLVNGGQPNKYLSAVFATDAFFAPKQVADGNIDYAALSTYPIIALSDIKNISTGLAQQLKIYVSKGGTLLVFPAADADVSSYQALLQPLGAASLGKLVTEATRATTINLQSTVFKNIFEAAPQNPDLPVVKQYYTLSGGSRASEYLMKLQNGQPLWQSSSFGRGKVYVAAVALNEDFSSLPVHALFVPLTLRIAMLSGHDQPLFYTAGSSAPIESVPLQSTEKQLVKLVRGTQTIIPEVKQQEGGTLLYLPDQLTGPGIYELKKQDSTAAFLAFNDNRSESDLSYLSPAQLKKFLPGNTALLNPDRLTTAPLAGTANSGMQLWKLCIILALIFLAAEILLIRFFKTGKVNIGPAANVS